MIKYNNSIREMELRLHYENRASLKSYMSRVNQKMSAYYE